MATPSELANDARCVSSCVSSGMQLPVLIYLFQQIAQNDMSPSELANEARCYASCIPSGMQLPVLIFLASQIAGGGTGGSGNLEGSGDPNGSVASTASPQFYWDTSGSNLYINSGAIGSTTWTQLV